MTIEKREFEQLAQVPALRHRVSDQLEALIISGSLAPGERLVEGDLAQQLGVSRGPIREALQMLARDGWVELRARHGAVVHTPSRKEIDDFFGLRRVLEVESARLAAINIKQDGVDRLRAALDRGRQVAKTNRAPLLEGFNTPGQRTLHEEIAEISDNGELIRMLVLLTKRNVWYSARLQTTPSGWYDGHKLIVDAICDHDETRAMTLMGEHIDATRRAYQERA